MPYEFDMIVIGAGAAGLTAAGMSALLGAKTALIEKHRLGGECTWTGCVPSKSLLRAAKIAHEMRTADRFGLDSVQPVVPFARVMDRVRRTREHIYDDADAPPNIEKLGVQIFTGKASFADPHAIDIQVPRGKPRRLTSRFFVIATGSEPKHPNFSARCLTNESLFELTQLPNTLLVLGAGPIGIEMAQAFQRLGSSVTVVTPGKRILPKDDESHSQQLRQCLSEEGVSFLLGAKVVALQESRNRLIATLTDNSQLEADAALAAIGRNPAIAGLQLEKADVISNAEGICIDRHCRTSQRHIFAAGDVTGQYRFTHMAEHMSKVAVTNAILRVPKTLDTKNVVWSTFTDPELAHLGEPEESLVQRRAKYATWRFPFDKLDRAIVEREVLGEVKVFTDRRGKILGASILGAHAGEMIAEYALAMRNGLRLADVANTIHPYPTYMMGNRKAADRIMYRQLDSPLLGLWGKLLGYRGQRKGSMVL